MKKVFHLLFSFARKIDFIIIFAVLASIFLGVVLLYSMVTMGVSSYVSTRDYQIQTISAMIGLCVALVLTLIDYEKIAKLWFIYVPAAVIPVLLTFTSLGVQPRVGVDDTAWLDIGFMTIQPSEILKIAFILSFAYHTYKVGDKINQPINLLLLGIHGAVPIGLIVLQGDDGTALVFAVIFLAMIFSAGLSWKLIALALVISPILIYLAWEFILLDHQKERFLVILDPTLDPLGVGYHQAQGKIALGSGQMYGKGLFDDSLIYVSEMHNDFIFSYLGQTLGFLGCIALCVVAVILMTKVLLNGVFAKDKLGRQICVGVFALFLVHYILNIGMVIGVMPVIGVPLPFVSAGGTAVLSMFASVGLVLSVHSHGEQSQSIFATRNRGR